MNDLLGTAGQMCATLGMTVVSLTESIKDGLKCCFAPAASWLAWIPEESCREYGAIKESIVRVLQFLLLPKCLWRVYFPLAGVFCG